MIVEVFAVDPCPLMAELKLFMVEAGLATYGAGGAAIFTFHRSTSAGVDAAVTFSQCLNRGCQVCGTGRNSRA